MHCASDVWVVCARLPMCIVACFVGFWGSVFCWWECIPTRVLFALFVKCFFYVLFGGVFFWELA